MQHPVYFVQLGGLGYRDHVVFLKLTSAHLQMLLILGTMPEQQLAELGPLVKVEQLVVAELLVMVELLVVVVQQVMVEQRLVLPSSHLQVLALVQLLVFRPLLQYSRFLSMSGLNICYRLYPKLFRKQSISISQPSYHL